MKLPPEQEAIRAKCFHPSGTFVEFPQEDVETSIPARFEKVARLYPKRIAVKTPTQTLSYEELNRAANRVARAILAVSGESQEPIGLLFSKSAALVVAMLGSLKAGKICVPMDPALPPARLSLMFDDMQASLLVTGQENLALASRLAGLDRCLSIDDLKKNRAEENPNALLSPDSLACLFYTSGSSGLPKGVMENHRNVLYHTMIDSGHFHICPEDKLTFVASSGRDIFRSILNGAAVYPIDLRQDGFAGLARRLMEEEITIFNCVTSAFRNFASAFGGPKRFPYLRLIGVTGETVYKKDFELYQKHFSDSCLFVNRYWPNEAGGISRYLMDKNTVVKTSVVPVGYGIKGKNIQLIDETGNQVGVGQAGEIVVTSRYLSPGYWRQPERTRAAFGVDPSDDRERVYRTGDIALMESDGCLVLLGRKDFQVKIRGNKVQLDAVEAALLNLETVREAAVIAFEDNANNKRLVAYIVARNVPGPTVSELRDALAASLPDYMVPSKFVFLDKLPVIGIGKVDRRALPAPDLSRPKLEVPYVAPRNEHEARLAAIWAEVLDLTEVGVLDNFFHLGGHSLGASRVIARVIQAFHLELPVKALFDSPTVADMAKVISENEEKPACQKEIERLLSEVEAMSDEEAQRFVGEGLSKDSRN